MLVGLSVSDPSGFSETITKVNGLYFTVTVLSTVDFGDITALTDGTRIAVTLQMVVDLLIVGVLVKVIIGASASRSSAAGPRRRRPTRHSLCPRTDHYATPGARSHRLRPHACSLGTRRHATARGTGTGADEPARTAPLVGAA